MSCIHSTGLFYKMVNHIIFFFFDAKANNRTSRTLWRRYGHDDVHLRLLYPWGNHNILCCAQVCFSSVSLEIKKKKSVFSISPHLLWYSASHSTSEDQSSRMMYVVHCPGWCYQEQSIFMLMGIICHVQLSSEKYSSGRLG